VLPYLDVPFQHSHPDVLKRMKRPASGEKNLERIQRWREICPELVIRSTFIAGFPARPKKSSSTCWTSCARRRSTAPAALPTAGRRRRRQRLPGMLPDEVREERRARFMAVAEEVSARCSAAWADHAGAGGQPPAWAARAAWGAPTPTRRRSTAPCDPAAREGQQDLKVGEFAACASSGRRATTWSASLVSEQARPGHDADPSPLPPPEGWAAMPVPVAKASTVLFKNTADLHKPRRATA
jgi:ribosomal protein S12 methylthiotransferase